MAEGTASCIVTGTHAWQPLTNGPGNYRVAVSNAASTGVGFVSSFAALTVQPAVQQPTISSYGHQPDGRFQMQFSGTVGASCSVLGSTNLLD